MVYSFTKEEKEKINSRLDAVLNEFITMVREANIGEREIGFPIGFNADYDSIGYPYPAHPYFYISKR